MLGLVAIEWAATDVQGRREDCTMGSTKVLVKRIGLVSGLGLAVAVLPGLPSSPGDWLAGKPAYAGATGGSTSGASGGSAGG
ncbi:MAG: hypothetical protein H7Z12_08405, partial [Rhodospirillaceae bacterium]|nr:hypothetical protein [Rhodospirillales bacterium]